MIQKILLFFICIPLLVFSQEERKNFELLMGKESSAWKYVETPEDRSRLEFFRNVFEKQLPLLNKSIAHNQIPKVIHFIWLGSTPFPEKSIQRIQAWVKLHPDWTFKFWTDQQTSPIHISNVTVCPVREFPFALAGKEYYDTVNFGEKAKLLAYEILFKEGGIYVDHDVIPYKSLEPLRLQLDFFCGLEKLGPSILSSSVFASTHLIGSKPNHPVMKEALTWLHNQWDDLEKTYPGESRKALLNRITHRTLWALSEGIDRGMNQENNRDIVFPTAILSEKTADSYTAHLHDSEWMKPPTVFESKIQKKFLELIKNDDEALLIVLFLSAASFVGCLFLLVYIRLVEKREES